MIHHQPAFLVLSRARGSRSDPADAVAVPLGEGASKLRVSKYKVLEEYGDATPIQKPVVDMDDDDPWDDDDYDDDLYDEEY